MKRNNIDIQDNFFDLTFLRTLQGEIMGLEFESRYLDIETNPGLDIMIDQLMAKQTFINETITK